MPSAQAAALAYADGVQTYGAQPIPHPEQGFYSFVYTDHGRTYKSHRWDGKEIAVHQAALSLNGAMSLLLKQREVGILTNLQNRRLLARRYNAKEKPIERFFLDVSAWEQHTFNSYCGSKPGQKPDRLKILYEQHRQYLLGNRESSPFPTIEQYHAALNEFITRYNHSEHERSNLGGERIVPIEEYRRLYTTRYEISRKTLALLLLIPGRRVIEKNGVNCFRKNWFYYHKSMSKFKGSSVEILYSDDDYKSVWIILPDGDLCEASLITPTSLLNPNRATLQTVREASAHERNLIQNYQLLQESQMRGETTEDRVARQSKQEENELPYVILPEKKRI
jgi:hypothetical protein